MKEAVFSLNETLKKGLALTVNARNKPFLIESVGAFPYENALMSVEQFDPIDTSSLGTLPFPYPQLFVCSECVIVCTPTAIYEHKAGLLVLKINNLPEGVTWTCIDYKPFIYLSNCSCAVIKIPQTGIYVIADDQYVPCRAGCDYFGQAVISPCPEMEESPPVPPVENILTSSCPQAVLWNDSDVWFITADGMTPVETLYIMKYSGGVWTTVYTTTTPNDPDDDPDGVSYAWNEPTIDVSSLGDIHVIALAKPYNKGDGNFPFEIDIYVFNGETLINHTAIDDTYGSILPDVLSSSHWVIIDSTGVIHILLLTYDGAYNVYDFRSTDNGATFIPVLVENQHDTTSAVLFIREDTGTIWVKSATHLLKSTDWGATWTYYPNSPPGGFADNVKGDWDVIGGEVYEAGSSYVDCNIARSQTFLTSPSWTTPFPLILTEDAILFYRSSIAFDGAYYYVIFNLRGYVVRTTGTNYVYRSGDGLTWNLVSSFIDDSLISPPSPISTPGGTSHLFYNGDPLNPALVYTYYKASTKAGDLYMLTMWISTDDGVTWAQIQTPFNDIGIGVI